MSVPQGTCLETQGCFQTSAAMDANLSGGGGSFFRQDLCVSLSVGLCDNVCPFLSPAANKKPNVWETHKKAC